jgi:hypothetical protein
MGNFTDVLQRRKFLQSTQPFADETPRFETTVGESTPEPDALESYKRAVLAQPQIADEPKPGLFRKILGAFAGYGEGANADAARELVRNPGYADKMREWARRTGNLGKVAEIETEQIMNRGKMGAYGARSQADIARAGYYGRGNRAYQPETKQDVLDIEAAKHPEKNTPIRGHVISRGIGGGKFHNILIDPTTGQDMQDLGEGRPFQGRMSFAEFKQRADYATGLKGTSDLTPSAEKSVRDNEGFNTAAELGLKDSNIFYDSTRKEFYAGDASGAYAAPTPEQQALIQRATLRYQQRIRAKLLSGQNEPFEGNTRYNPVEIDDEGDEE